MAPQPTDPPKASKPLQDLLWAGGLQRGSWAVAAMTLAACQYDPSIFQTAAKQCTGRLAFPTI